MTATDEHAIVTGGSSGIGLAVARLLLAKGWQVSILALADQDLESVSAELGSMYPDRLCVTAVDVTDPDAVARAVADVSETLAAPTALVTSAGIARPQQFTELADDVFSRMIDVNYHGTVSAISAVYPGFVERRRGRVAIISSGAGLLGIFGHTAYAPTKYAVRGLGEALRAEAKPHGISVTICYLPDVDTPQLRANTPIRPAETAAISGASKPWPVDVVAQRIVTGMESGRFSVAPGWQLTLLGWFASPLAFALRMYIDRIVTKVQAGSTNT